MLVVNLSLNMSNVNLSVLEFQIQSRILRNGNSLTHQKKLQTKPLQIYYL
jgi:hypothetical protein